MVRVLFAGLLGMALLAEVWGQYPGQTGPVPYPPGQYPPDQSGGTYPGGRGISIPRRSKNKKSKAPTDESLPVIAADGITVSNDGKKLVVKTKDGRWLTMTVAPTTQWLQGGKATTSSAVTPQTFVHVEAAEDDQSYLTAKSVEVKDVAETPAAPAASGAVSADGAKPAAAPKTNRGGDEEMAQSTILRDPTEPADRPHLHHGQPTAADRPYGSDNDKDSSAEKKTTEAASAKSTTDEAKAPPSDGSIDFTIGSGEKRADAKRSTVYTKLIQQTGEWAQTFTNGLPNFLCDQITTRYYEQSKAEGFQPVDIVTAKVLYEDGKEKYSQITVGGKRTNKNMMEVGGSTSTGEFASVLSGLFEPATHTEFTFRESTTVDRKAAAIYDLRVALVNSNWSIIVGGQMLRPEYTGSVWVDKASGQVRRIEMEAQNIPKDFPFDTTAQTIDYDEVSLGTSKFLLPVHAENLACERGSSRCSKNTIDFRDYHRYAGESTIEFH